ncbi:MAG: di-trans,poly-cis-decaprenylcistransferase, partial [Lachnospiraceae bacterium]|nr:di-trans,poly-cis-decaprenylcistransferase [Lachnospiraceae bacterium]
LTGLSLQICVNYGSRDEIRRAVASVAEDVKRGALMPSDITEDVISGYLDTKDIPDPDLMIRTSGEQRLSNYLLWQMAYTEFYFTDVAWPDFDRAELIKACEAYAGRNRRYGGI